jgi:SAM-dependent methyltransferase
MTDPAFDQLPDGWAHGAPRYHEQFEPFTGIYADTAADLLGLEHGERVLDVAAGTGAFTVRAARRGGQVTSIDFASGMVEVLRSRTAAEGLDVRAEVMDGQQLDLPDAEFHAACSMFGLMFFPDPSAGARELHRVLAPGGRVAIGTWDLGAFTLGARVRRALLAVAPDLPEPPPPTWAPLGNRDGLAALLDGAGFADTTVHHVVHEWPFTDAHAFFRSLPDWAPPMQRQLEMLPPHLFDAAADAFAAEVATDRVHGAAWIAVARK